MRITHIANISTLLTIALFPTLAMACDASILDGLIGSNCDEGFTCGTVQLERETAKFSGCVEKVDHDRFHSTDKLNIRVSVSPRLEHVDMEGEIVIIVEVVATGDLLARNAEGDFILLSRSVPTTIPVAERLTLQSENNITILSNQTVGDGDYNIYTAYRVPAIDDTLIYSSTPLSLSVL